MSFPELDSLLHALNTAVQAFKSELTAQGLSEPSLNTSKLHPIDAPTFLPSPALHEARRAALASLGLLKVIIQSPHDALVNNTGASLESAGLDLPTILGDSEDGIHIDKIAAKTGVNANKLERVLRLLITEGWFREPKGRHFANSRLSNLIKKGQPGYHGATYMNELCTKLAGSLPKAINHPDPEFRNRNDPAHSAFQLAYDTDVPYFGADGWLAKHPEDAQCFGALMGTIGPMSDPGVANDFPWETFARGKDAIVDVGGGQGTLCCSLASLYPNIPKFIVQDLPEAKLIAEAFIASKDLTGRVEFESQDFFKPQQRKGKYLFLLQRVLHDWSTEDAAKILRQIRDVLNDDSAPVIFDNVIQSAVASSTGSELSESLARLDGGNYTPVSPPPYVPADFGEYTRVQHVINVALTGLCNAFERTLPELEETVKEGGFTIKKLYATRGWPYIVEVIPA